MFAKVRLPYGVRMSDGSGPALFINPPWIIAPDIGAFAVDVTLGAPPAGVSTRTPLLCLGGHPAQECLLDVRGSGPDHDVVVSVCDLGPDRVRLLERLVGLIRPSAPLQVLVASRVEAH